MQAHVILQALGAMPVEARCFCSFLLCCYLLPTIVAFANNHKARWDILLINVVLGWSGIFWFVALLFAFTAEPRKNPG